jgi:hypothetical protein
MTAKNDFIEQRIIEAVRNLLTGRMNEIFRDWELLIPVIEFGNIGAMYAVAPVVSLSSCERSEKERLIRQDAYSLSITFTLHEHEDGELYCYAYSTAFAKALSEDLTLGGIAERAIVTGKKYLVPKKPNCGEGWGLIISVRITTEGMNNAG